MAFVPTITWNQGREGGTRINATRLTQAFAEVATYAEGLGGGGGGGSGTTVVDVGTVATNQTLNMTNYTSVLWKVTLGNSVKLDIVNWAATKSVVLWLRQDSVGNRAVSQWPIALWEGGAQPTNSKSANALDILSFVSDGVATIGIASGLDFA